MSVTNGAYDREDGNNVELRLRRNRGLEGGDDSLKEAQYSPPSSWPVGMDDLSNLRRWDSAEEIAVSVHQVARDGDAEALQRLLKQLGHNKRRKINVHDENELSPLHYACRYNHTKVVQLLIEYGANVSNRGEDGMTPLHFAARFKRTKTVTYTDEDGNEETADEEGESSIRYMVKKGADVNVKDIYGLRPLHFAAMRGNDIAASELLDCQNVVVDCLDKQQMTPLHIACTHGNVEIASMLIAHGGSLRSTDYENSTPLHHACLEGHLGVVQLLFEAGEKQNCLDQMLTDRDIDYNTPMHLAVDAGSSGIVQLCIEKGSNVNTFDKNRNTPIHEAAVAGNIGIIKMLLGKGARIDAVNLERSTPLHKACAYNRFHVVEFLLRNGARIERRDKDNFTALLIACSSGHHQTIKVLMDNKADITCRDKHDKTAMFWAAEENQPEGLKALLNHPKAKLLLEETDRYGNSPLHIASEKGFITIVKILLEAGADIDTKNEEEQTPLHLAAKNGRTQSVIALVRHDETVINDEDESSNTPLHLAAMEGHSRVVEALIDAGADITARNQSQWTPLDCCAASGYTKTAFALLDNDSAVDPTDKAKTTPLHLAAKNGHLDMVKLLLEWHADISLKDSNGHNCLDLAIDKGKETVAEAIVASDKWLEAMMSVSYDPVTKWRVTPMRKLIVKMPEVAEQVFHRCLTENDKPRNHPDYCITFDYELLDDVFSQWDDTTPDDMSSTSSSSTEDKSPYLENGQLSSHAKTYTMSAEIMKKNHPLLIMVNEKQEDLLAHPLVTSLLQHKWASYGRLFYYLSLAFYLVFLMFLTGYIITNPPSFYIKDIYDNGTVIWRADGKERWEDGFSDFTHFLFGEIGPVIIIALSAVNLFREVIQIYHQKWNYIGLVNLLEWSIYVLAILLSLPISDKTYYNGTIIIRERLGWQWECGAVGIFLAWFNLIIFMRKFPALGIYVVMFTDILKTFMQFMIVFFLFIVAFALAFYALLMNQQPFHRVQYALIKTFVMMIGEFEFDTMFHTQTYINYDEDINSDQYFLEATYYEGVLYAVFTVFLVIMSILIMNLLVGLAVDDIKEVQEQAKLQRLAMQVDLAMEVQEALPTFIWRRSIIKKRTVYPNRNQGTAISRAYYSFIGTEQLAAQAITRALNPPKTELEEVAEQTEAVVATVVNLKSRMKSMRQQNERIESMLKAIMTHQQIEWAEGETTEGVSE